MKKRFFYLFPLFILLLLVVYSCKDDNNEPTPPEPSPEITVPDSENQNPVLSQEGGTVSISFTTTADWTASLVNTRAESWITVTPSSGIKGKNEITITTTANETYDERNATVVLKCGSASKNIVVTQKQKDALTVTSSKYEVASKGGNISVEVKANINFEVEIKADWIKQQTEKTRALTTSNLNFTIEPNDTGDKREGEIIIKSGELSETVKVYQGFGDFITLTKKDFTIPEEGGKYETLMKLAMENVFSIEPIKSLRDYFDVIAIKAVSENDWASGKTAFETLSRNGIVEYNMDKCKEYALKATGCNSLNNTHIILVNLHAGAQTTTETGRLPDDSFYQTSLSCCRYNKKDPDGLEYMIHKIVIGYGIGLLHNEHYIPDISSSSPTLIDIESINSKYVEFGQYANIDFTDDLSRIRWAHFVDDSRYKNEGIGAYEGGGGWIYSVYRPTKYSIMREGIWENGKTHYIVNQFNAPSREAIYKNIMKRANGKSWTYDFEEFVELDAQGREDWMEAINNINESSIQRDSKYIYPKHYNHPIVIK